MFTSKSISLGLLSISILCVAMWLVTGFSQISSTKASGRGVLLPNLVGVLMNPVFWVLAVLLFLGTAFLVAKRMA